MDLKLFAEAYHSVQEKKLDPVGKEDGDIDNDGDKDSSDSYLMKRRKAIAKAMKKEEVEKDKIEEVQQMDEFVGAALGALDTANKVVNVAKGVSAIANTMKKKKDDDGKIAEHHQKDADGKVIEHDDTTPSSVEEESQETVLSKLTENGEGLDMFDAVVAYLIDEGFAETLEEAQKIMPTLKPELVEEVYQNQLWNLFDEGYQRNPEADPQNKPYKEKSKKERMADPDRGINSPAFKKFMASQGM